MKFAVAAAILAQTLPIASEKASTLGAQHDHNDLDLQQDLDYVTVNQLSWQQGNTNKLQLPRYSGQHLKISPLTDAQKCDPLSHDPDVGILSCEIGYYCKSDGKSLLGGTCAPGATEQNINGLINNAFRTTNTLVDEVRRECDPAADVGVLSVCSDDQDCVVDEKSSMGGLCTSTFRELQDDEYCFLCPPGEVIPEDNYDVDLVDGPYGDITCADLLNAAYFAYTDYVTVDTNTCPLVAEAARNSGCCVPDLDDSEFCDMCGPGLYLAEANFDIVLDIPIDGYEGTTCQDLFFSYNATVYAYCPTIAEIAQTSGCCGVSIPSPGSCRMCGTGTSLLENTVISIQGNNRTCGDIQADDTSCSQYSLALYEVCCEVLTFPTISPTTLSDQQSDVPTASPQESQSEAASPSSASRMSWSPTTVVLSMIGLLSTTAGRWELS